MSIAGIVAGGLGAAGQAIGDQAGKAIEEEHKGALAQQMADIDLAKHKAAEDYKVQLENQQRTAQVGRIDEASKGIIASRQNDKINSLYGPDSKLTADDISDEERAAIPLSAGERRDARLEAAEQTGDIDPKTMATTTTKQDVAQRQMEGLLQKIQSEADSRNMRSDIMLKIAEMKQGNSGNDKVLGHLMLSQFDRKMSLNEAEIKSLRASRSQILPTDKAGLTDVDTQISALKAANDRLLHGQIAFAKGLGIENLDSLEAPDKPAPGAPKPGGNQTMPLPGQPKSASGVVDWSSLK
jgi:hypothetical protein